mmetsp:Transcript_124541/g.186046  ORF Transcript_124541/g.186046 Transcript_124541/m.186046 type:complete len:111 (+) Transcript_124541:78-410(+)|eukprot:CAMPEP_0117027588 /NCGR_PEP_ID=MMETSP0472-20121206/20151_1 /TAXON_ID=693140 ORGANISM="Tiarina fusus, Strain LIS" /NCGR_SAMPLE_ID=MMETSP0472 /ASSEMBLY_ACC=CAM_ASM_000603 /LENGTH=110 /DNA_ID=CAMNT_0004734873 /DNA_START=60 /DNA_END=392 /DNA_ORIENTATION=-
MAQGNHKLGKAKKSRGAAKRKQVNTVKKTRKGNASVERNKSIASVSKAINKKNERLVAAKALNGGTSFFLKDIAQKGNNESKRQNAERDKKQKNSSKLSGRLQEQINKLK